ncbi:hypothetical protein ABZ281_26170 [Streptomyces sp. NPDC006265]|uniref:hypothetical protein n=1 Tax=Streptomyces sp. NPDC006265 TaxID=3156740 RepID=UPI0033BC2048
MTTGTGVAQAADNLPPKQPLVQDSETGHKECAAGDERTHVSGAPTLTAVLYDQAWWTDADGLEQHLTRTTLETHSGDPQRWHMPERSVSPNTVISWRARRCRTGTSAAPPETRGGPDGEGGRR